MSKLITICIRNTLNRTILVATALTLPLLSISEVYAADSAQKIVDVTINEDSWETITDPRLTFSVTNNSNYMMSIERIELNILPGDAPVSGNFELVIPDFEDQLIEPGGSRSKQLTLDIQPDSILNTIFYERHQIGMQFEFHPGGAMEWAVESSDTVYLEPNAPILSVMIGSIVGVLLNFLLLTWGKYSFARASAERKKISEMADRISWRQFISGSLFSLVAIYLLRASDNMLRDILEEAGLVAFDFTSGVIIGLSFHVIVQIILSFIMRKRPQGAELATP